VQALETSWYIVGHLGRTLSPVGPRFAAPFTDGRRPWQSCRERRSTANSCRKRPACTGSGWEITHLHPCVKRASRFVFYRPGLIPLISVGKHTLSRRLLVCLPVARLNCRILAKMAADEPGGNGAISDGSSGIRIGSFRSSTSEMESLAKRPGMGDPRRGVPETPQVRRVITDAVTGPASRLTFLD